MRAEIREDIVLIRPLDDAQRDDKAAVPAWIDSGIEICRLEKPATPPNHLLAYFAVVDGDYILRTKRTLLVESGRPDDKLPTGCYCLETRDSSRALVRNPLLFRRITMTTKSPLVAGMLLVAVLCGCAPEGSGESAKPSEKASPVAETREYFYLRPEVEKAYGYTHAVKVGNDIKISGAVSMDSAGNPTAIGDLEQQMKNAYSDLDQVLKHYGLSFDDVIVENIFTTDMAKFLEVAAFRSSIYADQFPTGTWLEVKGLALPEFMIEIELEAHSHP